MGATVPRSERLNARVLDTDDRGRAYLGAEYADAQVTLYMLDSFTDLEEIPVYHGRHNTTKFTDDFRATLWAEYFGLHWFDGPHTGRWRFEEEQRAIEQHPDRDGQPLIDWKNLNKLATNGGLLTLRDTMFEPADTRLMRLSFVPPQAITPIPFEADGETRHAKAVRIDPQLSVVVTDKADSYPKLFSGIAPPRGSLREWNKHADVPRQAFEDLFGER